MKAKKGRIKPKVKSVYNYMMIIPIPRWLLQTKCTLLQKIYTLADNAGKVVFVTFLTWYLQKF